MNSVSYSFNLKSTSLFIGRIFRTKWLSSLTRFPHNSLEQALNRPKTADTAGRHLAGFTVQYSDDGITWTTLSTQSGLLYPGNHSFSPYYYVSE